MANNDPVDSIYQARRHWFLSPSFSCCFLSCLFGVQSPFFLSHSPSPPLTLSLCVSLYDATDLMLNAWSRDTSSKCFVAYFLSLLINENISTFSESGPEFHKHTGIHIRAMCGSKSLREKLPHLSLEKCLKWKLFNCCHWLTEQTAGSQGGWWASVWPEWTPVWQ